MKKIKFKLAEGAKMPTKATTGAACWDIYANVEGVIYPGERVLIRTGLLPEIPEGYEIQIRPRSGLTLNHGITVLNSPGTIDSDFRGEIGVILINHCFDKYLVQKGERIAQIAIKKVENFELIEVDKLTPTDRGEGGFGSTGK